MTTLEQLAIEHGATEGFLAGEPAHGNNRTLTFTITELEAFAKALQQSSEPVAYLSNTLHLAYMADEILEENKQRYTPLFTHPPSSVPLEKYNKLLGILKRMEGWLEVRNLGGLMPDEKALIAEAEGKEG